MNNRGRGWRWGARPAIVALVGVVVGYLTNIVSAGNHSVAAVVGFGCAVVAFLGVVWWDSARQAGTTADQPTMVKQRVGTVRNGSVIGGETVGAISDDYNVTQRVNLAENSDIIGIRHVRPNSSQGQP